MRELSVVVVVPVYKPELLVSERFTLRRLREVLPEAAISFVIPDGLKPPEEIRRFPGAEIQRVPTACLSSIEAYNEFLLRPEFYELFTRYEWMLIHQLDAMLLSDALNHWCEQRYDYVGAPFWADYGLRKDKGFVGVGNGGLSLRRTEASIRVTREVVAEKIPMLGRKRRAIIMARRHVERFAGEDMWWGWFAADVAPFSVAPASAAVDFAFETGLELLLKANPNYAPFGCHAQWNVDIALELLGLAPPADPAAHGQTIGYSAALSTIIARASPPFATTNPLL